MSLNMWSEMQKNCLYHKYFKWKNLNPHGVVVYIEVNL